MLEDGALAFLVKPVAAMALRAPNPQLPDGRGPAPAAIAWGLIAAALALMYVPVFQSLASTLWTTDQNAHGPIVLGVAAWFFWYRAREVAGDAAVRVAPLDTAGLVLMLIGAALYVVGESQDFYLFSVGSLIPLLAGAVLFQFGTGVLRRLWFAFFFLLFAVPMPGALVDVLTHPMKIAVSWGADQILHALGYPISRAGVILAIGPYQLLVADACAGLNSLFTLEALGLLYMNLMRHESVWRNTALALLIVPISMTSNIIRVIILCLVTFHFGDEAGQGFLHGFSGMVLFLSALMLVIMTDGLLRRLVPKPSVAA